MPTLVEIARRRQVNDRSEHNNALKNGRNVKDDVNVAYHLTDLDVLNFTDEVKRKIANRSHFASGVRFGSAGTQATLGALAGAANTFNWGVGTASGLGAGATYIFGMGEIFDAKGHAQAFEQAFTAIQAAEANYYFRQLGMGFNKVNGQSQLDLTKAQARCDIPSNTYLTPDGETLYYRVSKILKVLEDTLASKIPDLQDLKEANGESGGSGSPLIHTDAPPTRVQKLKPVVITKPIPPGLTRPDNIQAVVASAGEILRSFPKDQAQTLAQKALDELKPGAPPSPTAQEDITAMLMDTTTMEQAVRILTALQHAKQ